MEKPKIKWIDIARTIAIMGVVVNHVLEKVYNVQMERVGDNRIFSQLFLDKFYALGRMGVPIFLMLSGYLLLDREWNDESCVKFWKKNWLSLLITAEIWWLIYETFAYVFYDADITGLTLIRIVLLVKEAWFAHNWYIYMILGYYVCIPFAGKALSKFKVKTLLFPIVFFTVFIFLVPTLGIVLADARKEVVVAQVSNGFIGDCYGLYLIYGYLMKKDVFSKIQSKLLWIIGVVALILVVSLQLWTNAVGYNAFIRYDNIFLLILSLAVFELISRIEDIQVLLQKIFNNLAGASFGIYLVHKIVIALVEKNLPNIIKNKPLTTLVWFTISFVSSWGIVMLIAQIPKLRKVMLRMN